jgi:hypothetical protein
MEEQPASPSPAPAPTWSITKSEWDGMAARASRMSRFLRWLCVALPVVAVGAAVTAVLLDPPWSSFAWFACAIALLYLVVGATALIRVRRRVAVFPEVWEAQGCACPWCRERVDAAPCRRHGFTRSEHALLLRYWEALALKDVGRIAACTDQLAARRRHTGAIRYAASSVASRFARPFRSYAAAINDADAAPMERLRRTVPFLLMLTVLGALFAAVLVRIAGWWMLVSMFSGCWWAIIVIPLTALAGPVWKVGRLRCASCKQLCAHDAITRCPECGADLTTPGAVTRTERRSGVVRAAAVLIPVGTILLGPLVAKSIIGMLPTDLRHLIYVWTRPPLDYFSGLNPAAMTQAEVDEAAELLIACASPEGPRPLLDFSFLCNAERAGKLTPAILEGVARATVEATLTVEQDGDAVVATVTPAFGELILGSMKTPRLVFGGVLIDDEPWTKGADWSLFAHDIEAFWRSNGQLPALPASQLVFTGRIEDAPKGLRAVRARCWIVIHGPQWERYTPTFDGSGALAPPAGALVYPLELRTTIEIK